MNLSQTNTKICVNKLFLIIIICLDFFGFFGTKKNWITLFTQDITKIILAALENVCTYMAVGRKFFVLELNKPHPFLS